MNYFQLVQYFHSAPPATGYQWLAVLRYCPLAADCNVERRWASRFPGECEAEASRRLLDEDGRCVTEPHSELERCSEALKEANHINI